METSLVLAVKDDARTRRKCNFVLGEDASHAIEHLTSKGQPTCLPAILTGVHAILILLLVLIFVLSGISGLFENHNNNGTDFKTTKNYITMILMLRNADLSQLS